MATSQTLDCLEFTGFPLYVQERIIKRMSFQGYAVFMQTCQLAHHIDLRNHNQRYRMENVNHISIECDLEEEEQFEEQKKKKVLITHVDGQVLLSFEDCEKMMFSSAAVTVNDHSISFTKELCQFLMKIDEITTLKCKFLEYDETHMADFFKKATIRTLEMTTKEQFFIDSFPYDTSNIEYVEVDDCKVVHPEISMSIKARRQVRLISTVITSDLINSYIEKAMISEMPELVLHNHIMVRDDYEDLKEFLNTYGNKVGDSYALTRRNETDPFMNVRQLKDRMEFRFIQN